MGHTLPNTQSQICLGNAFFFYQNINHNVYKTRNKNINGIFNNAHFSNNTHFLIFYLVSSQQPKWGSKKQVTCAGKDFGIARLIPVFHLE